MALLPWQVTEYNVTLQLGLLIRVYVWKSGMGLHKESLLSTSLDDASLNPAHLAGRLEKGLPCYKKMKTAVLLTLT